MSDIAIKVENLGKAYRIGAKEEIPDTFMGAIASGLKAPIQNLRRLRQLNTFEQGNNPDSDAETIFWALQDVSFEVKHGEVMGIIGRNGAGKSTLLKILSRITEPTQGRVTIFGRVSSLLEVGTGFHPELSGRENIYMNGTILGMRKREIDRKFDEIVDFSGVEKFLDTPIKRYSSGMKVRLAFAVAAHLEPEILIIDEVLAVGDAEFQKKCMGKMHDVATGGKTVLFVSHNMAAIESLCTEAIELSAGTIVCEGKPKDVVAHYRQSAFGRIREGGIASLDGKQLVESVAIIDKLGKITNFIAVGEEITIQLCVNAKLPIRFPKIGIGIDFITGERALTVHTPNTNNSVNRIENRETIYCKIPEFPLAPGDYTLKIAISDNMEELESVNCVCPFSIVDGPLFDEGRGFHKGVCVAKSKWIKGEAIYQQSKS